VRDGGCRRRYRGLSLSEDEFKTRDQQDDGKKTLDGSVVETAAAEIGTGGAANDRGDNQDDRE
jgi:hypothetical protein